MLKMNCTSPKPKLFATYRCSEREKTQSFNRIKRPRLNLHGSEICPDACQRGLRVFKNRVKISDKDQKLRKEFKVEGNLPHYQQHLRAPRGNISL